MRRSMLTLAQIPLYSVYRRSSRLPGRGVVNCSGSGNSLFAIRSRLSIYASCNRPSGFEFILGYHQLARGHRRIQPRTPAKPGVASIQNFPKSAFKYPDGKHLIYPENRIIPTEIHPQDIRFGKSDLRKPPKFPNT